MLLSLDDRIFGLDWQLVFNMLFQGIAIFILFMVASRLLLDPVRKILNDRKARVMKEMRDAVENREQAIRMKEEYDEKLRNVDRTAEEILSDSKKKALKKESEIIAEARTEASRIIESAKREAELEKKRVKDEVKQEMISVAALMSEKIIGETVDPGMHEALIEQTLDEIGDDTWLN